MHISAPSEHQLGENIAAVLPYINTDADMRLLHADMKRLLSSVEIEGDKHRVDLVPAMLQASFPLISAVHFHLALPRYVQSVG